MNEKEKLIKLLKKVIITGKTYTEYIEAIADRLIEEGYVQKENKDVKETDILV